MKLRQNKGFTLIELLVVIAIIALLLSIIIPSLKKAKYHARKVIDSTNLRSLSTAVHIYLNLYNDTFFDYGSGSLWMDRIGEMVDNLNQVRLCPETIARQDELGNANTNQWGESTLPWRWNNPLDPTRPYIGSYGLNGWMYRECGLVPANENSFLYKKRTAVRNPSNTPFILDANWVDGWPRSSNTLPTTGYRYDLGDQAGGNATVTSMIGRYIMDRHGPETNVIFLDGQVKTIPHTELWTLSWHVGAQPRFGVTPPQPEPKKK